LRFTNFRFLGYTSPSSPGRLYQALSQKKLRRAGALEEFLRHGASPIFTIVDKTIQINVGRTAVWLLGRANWKKR